MKIGIKVGDIMTRLFASIPPSSTVSECSKEMITKKVGSLIIAEDQHLKGILTEGDIIKAIAKFKDLDKVKAEDVMTRKVVSISPGEDIYEALLKMKKHQIRWLPVTVKGKVIGLLTEKDILVIEPSLFDIVAQHIPIREEHKKFKAAELRKKNPESEGEELWHEEGECQECGNFDVLYNVGGKMLCEDCKEEQDK